MSNLQKLFTCASRLRLPRRAWQAESPQRLRRTLTPSGQFRASHRAESPPVPPLAKLSRDSNAPFYVALAFGSCCGFYYSSQSRPILCEAPDSSKRELRDNGDPYNFIFPHATIEAQNQHFTSQAQSGPGFPATGLLRWDHTGIPALKPCEDHSTTWLSGDFDDYGELLDGGLSLAMWGIFDGHSGPATSHCLALALPDYIERELRLKAGLAWNATVQDKEVLAACSPEEIDRAMKDAFVRLDNDILKAATEAITGSIPLQRAMHTIEMAESGSCALLAMYDVTSQLLRVACVGDSRAVLGRRKMEGGWETIPLSVDQTGQNEQEVARLQAEHPGEADMVKKGRVLGLAVTRAFGDLRWKLSHELQSLARHRFFGLPLLSSLLTPPYLTAEPAITTTKINPENNDFLILASDGLWDNLSSEQAVELVGHWLAKNNPEHIPSGNQFSIKEPENGRSYVVNPADRVAKGKVYTDMKYGDEKNWVVVDENAASHLARNAMGGGDEELFSGLVGWGNTKTLRRMRDDITVKVIFFGNLKPPPEEATSGDEDSESADSITHY